MIRDDFDLEKHCDIHREKDPDATVFLFHGLNSTKRLNRGLMNYISQRKNVDLINCDARGYGSRRHLEEDWIETLNDYKTYLKNHPKDHLIFIGKSFGGALPFQFQELNPEKIFVIGGLHNEKIDGGLFHRIRIGSKIHDLKERYKEFTPYASEFDNSSQNLYLIHSTKDRVVPFSQFEKNVEHFNVPENQQFIIEHKLPLFTHARTMNNRDAWEFIIENLF